MAKAKATTAKVTRGIQHTIGNLFSQSAMPPFMETMRKEDRNALLRKLSQSVRSYGGRRTESYGGRFGADPASPAPTAEVRADINALQGWTDGARFEQLIFWIYGTSDLVAAKCNPRTGFNFKGLEGRFGEVHNAGWQSPTLLLLEDDDAPPTDDDAPPTVGVLFSKPVGHRGSVFLVFLSKVFRSVFIRRTCYTTASDLN